jgi:hypothetical protein
MTKNRSSLLVWIVLPRPGQHPPHVAEEVTHHLAYQQNILKYFVEWFSPRNGVLVPFSGAADDHFLPNPRCTPHTFASCLHLVDYPIHWFLVHSVPELQCVGLVQRMLDDGTLTRTLLRRNTRWEEGLLRQTQQFFRRDKFLCRGADADKQG